MAVKPGSAWWILGTGAMSTHGEEPKFPDAGPVVDLILTPSGTSVAMSWMPPNPLPGVVPPVGYVVKLDDTGETRETTETNYIWDGLQIDTDYCFSVYSKTELGVLSEPVSDCVLTLKEVSSSDAAQISHIGTSTFAISNPTRGIFEYYLSRSDTDFSQASLISNPSSFTVSRNGGGDRTPYYVLTTYPGVTETSIMGKTAFVCTKVTYTNVNEPIWVPCTPPGPTQGCCVKCDGSDWSCCYGGSPCVDGTLCCVGCSGGSWEPNYVPKKDTWPAGYTEKYGEWVKIDNPVVRGVSVEEDKPSVFSAFEWDDPNYYLEFDCPVDPAQQDIQVSLMFFDENDLPYIALASSHDTDNFQFAKPIGEITKLRVKNIQGVEMGSRWELEFLAVDEKDGTDEGEYSEVLEKVEGNV